MVPFVTARSSFLNGSDSPRDFLERSLERLEQQEPVLGAFSSLSVQRARLAADAATQRWRAGRPLSGVDGMPLGVKDIIDVADLPTGLGSPAADSFRPLCDAACVFALREAGAAIVGKTTTTEFAGSFPVGTKNPLDTTRTPGGSSSGSAAAVASGMLTVGLGTQVIGSILRPASFCGVFGYKPTVGAINRGGSHERHLSHSCIGALGASLEDLWMTTVEVVRRVGGDAGEQLLVGSDTPPAPVRPQRVAVIRPPEWNAAPGAEDSLEALLSRCSHAGVTVLTRDDDGDLLALERAVAEALDLARDIVAHESVWPIGAIVQRDPLGVSAGLRDRVAAASTAGREAYQSLLERRSRFREVYGRVASGVDAVVSLSAAGAAPLGRTTTGDPSFTAPAAVLGVPSVSLPLLEDSGLPVGLQLSGSWWEDERLFGVAAWFVQEQSEAS
jgi:Asp-tRNA(Asn)/Glu-tRNA(Gln) amidotransferase A subunit family amidase